MISYNKENGNITCSYGDSFTIRFTLKNYVLKAGDVATFSVKSIETKKIVMQGSITDVGSTQLDFSFSASDVKAKLPIGTYLCDLVIMNGTDWVYTPNFTSNLEVVEVAHYE